MTFYFLLLINVILMISYLYLGYKIKNYRLSVLNPIYFLSILNLFFSVDFWVLLTHHSQYINIYEKTVILSYVDIIKGYSYYLLCFFTWIMGSYIAYFSKKNLLIFNKFIKNIDPIIAKIMFYIILIFSILAGIYILLNIELFLTGQVTRQVFFREFKILNILFLMIPVAFAIYIIFNVNKVLKIFLYSIILLIIVLLSGSRGEVILLILILLTFFHYYGKMFKVWYYILFIPLLAYILIVLRYVFRESWRYSSLEEFIDAHGGIFNLFFNTVEVSMAEVITTIIKYNNFIDRYPYESFIGGILYPIPRSLIHFKPLSSGGTFTQYFSPYKWELTKSEIITTGFGDLFMQFNWLFLIFAMFILFIISYLWSKIIFSYTKYNNKEQIFVLPFLLWWAYVFFRSGIYNTFIHIWIVYIYIFILIFITIIFRNFIKEGS